MAVDDALTVGASTASMAAAGAALGPIGAGVGAAVGLTLGLMQNKAQKDAEKEAKKRERKQRERARKAQVASEVAQRREDAQAREARNRAIKEGSEARGPSMASADQLLQSSMSGGPGTPYDQYMASTYGRPFSA